MGMNESFLDGLRRRWWLYAILIVAIIYFVWFR